MKLGEEAGEVCEALAAFTGSESKIRKFTRKNKFPKVAVKEELGDVIVVCLNIATLCGIGHEELFEFAAEKTKRRAGNVRDRERSK